MIKNYKIIIQYDGSKYNGWQKQGNTDRTIQGKFEAVLEKMAEAPVEVFGAGRTDAGVHALAQTANFKTDTKRTAEEIGEYLNQYLPEDIAVLAIEEVPLKFHSRLNAKEKTYLYRIDQSMKKDVFERKYGYGLGTKLDLDRMREAAELLLGEHDFKGFSSGKNQKKSTVRNLEKIMFAEEKSVISIRFTGNGYLYNMVRILAGTLIEIGQGRMAPEYVREIFNSRDRQKAGFTAPPEGLFLEYIQY